MRTLVYLVITAAFGQIALVRSGTPKPEQYYVDLLRWIDYADVKADFHRNVKERHDTRFISVNGISSNMVLGVGNGANATVQEHGFWLIEGTSDVALGDEQARLNAKAIKYARQYNALLLKYLSSPPAH